MGGGASKQRVATLKRHSGPVYAVACYTAKTGAVRVVSGSYDDTIKIWDPETRRLLATLRGHTGRCVAVASYTTQAGAVRVVSGSYDTPRSGTRTTQRLRHAARAHRRWRAVATTTQAGAVRVVSGRATTP